MPDRARIRNVSDQGDLEVPALGLVIPYRHEAVVDADVAESLIASGHFVAVHRQSDDPPTPPDEPGSPTPDSPPATPPTAEDTPTSIEEQQQ